jgi:hypothetical protein
MNGATGVLSKTLSQAPKISKPNISVQPPPIAERLRQRLTAVTDKVRQRFVLATSAFQDRLAWENGALSPPGPRGPERRLAGYLFPTEGGRAMPLFEGTGSEWRIEQDFIELFAADGTARRFQTNECLSIGDRKYLVKIFESSRRIVVTEADV